MESNQFGAALHYLIIQNTQNAAMLSALLGSMAEVVAKQNDMPIEDARKMITAAVDEKLVQFGTDAEQFLNR